MEDHYNYFISDNDIRPRFWASDSEGINFHLWGDSIHTYVAEGKTNKIVLNREEMKKQYERIPYFANYINPDGTIKDGALNGWELLVCANRGLGQLRRVVRCENNVIYTDAALDCALDGNTMVSIRQYKFFHNTYVLNNNIADCGRAIYYWGCGFNSYVDGNKLKHNGGIVFEDISKYKELRRSWTQFAGNYYNQIIANEVCAGRGFGSNVCIIGACSGGVESGVVSLIVRDNQAADDVSYAAFPRIEADDGLNYMGVVFEKNSVENTKVGFYLSANIEAVLCDNQIKNVDTEYIHAGGNICFI